MPLQHFSFIAMASPCHIHLYGDALAAELAADAAAEEVHRIELRYSRYRDDSELSRINRAAQGGGTAEVDAETAALLDFAFAAWRKSDGLFDISSGLLRRAWNFQSGVVPTGDALRPLLDCIGLEKVQWRNPTLSFAHPGMELDFGGIGKEYAADRAAEVARSYGLLHGLVDLGGDIAVIGPHPDGLPWTVDIRHPRRSDASLAQVGLRTGGLASSGDYERFIEVDGRRYCHILNPRTGMPCRGLQAVSIAADTCLGAGALATTAMLKGREGPAWLSGLRLPHLVVDEAGEIAGTLAPDPGGSGVFFSPPN